MAIRQIAKANAGRKKKASDGLIKLLGRDINQAKVHLDQAVADAELAKSKGKFQVIEDEAPIDPDADVIEASELIEPEKKSGKKSEDKKKGKGRKNPSKEKTAER